jgi:hypothetical protein
MFEFLASYGVEYVHVMLVSVTLPHMRAVVTNDPHNRIAAEACGIFVLDGANLVVLVNYESLPNIDAVLFGGLAVAGILGEGDVILALATTAIGMAAGYGLGRWARK